MNDFPARLDQVNFSKNSRQRETLRAKLLQQADAQLPHLIHKEKRNMYITKLTKAFIAIVILVAFTLGANWLTSSFIRIPARRGTPTSAPDTSKAIPTVSAPAQESSTATAIPEFIPSSEVLTILPRSLYYLAKDANEEYQIYRLERDGVTVTQITFEENDPQHPKTSPEDLTSFDISPTDGTIVYRIGNRLIATDANGGNRRVLLEEANSKLLGKLVWLPDGKKFIYKDRENIYLYSMETGNSALILTEHGNKTLNSPLSISPDGKRLLIDINYPNYVYDPYVRKIGTYDFASKFSPKLLTPGNNLPYYCSEIIWKNSNKFFCYQMIIGERIMSGLFEANLINGNYDFLIWSTGKQPFHIPLVVAPRQGPDGKLYYLYGEDDGVNRLDRPLPVLSLVSSDVDGFTNRIVLRPETFLVRDAIWTPDNRAVVVLQNNEKLKPVKLLLVPLDPSQPVVTLLADAHNLIEKTFHWGPDIIPIQPPTPIH